MFWHHIPYPIKCPESHYFSCHRMKSGIQILNKALESRKTVKMLLKFCTPIFCDSTRTNETNNGFLDNAHRGMVYMMSTTILYFKRYWRKSISIYRFPRNRYRCAWRKWSCDTIAWLTMCDLLYCGIVLGIIRRIVLRYKIRAFPYQYFFLLFILYSEWISSVRTLCSLLCHWTNKFLFVIFCFDLIRIIQRD